MNEEVATGILAGQMDELRVNERTNERTNEWMDEWRKPIFSSNVHEDSPPSLLRKVPLLVPYSFPIRSFTRR
jgi:hypothetical protein